MQNVESQIFEREWLRHLDGHPFWKGWAASSPTTHALVDATLRTPGKRLRPMLFLEACRAFGCEPLPNLAPAALALELAHNFILVHDDVMDRSKVRRGAPTLAQRMDLLLAGKDAGGFAGCDLALVTGDLLYTMAVESLLAVEAPAERVLAATKDFMRAAMDTGRGALMEIRASQSPMGELTPEQIEPIYALKTGGYSFALPMKLAAAFSHGGARFPFAAFGEHAGIAYQIKNDRTSLSAWLDGGAVPDDVRDRRRTWAALHAWRAQDEAGRRAFDLPPDGVLKSAYGSARTLEAMDEAIARHGAIAMDLAPGERVRVILREALSLAPPT
jgi:geranylgeranyl pyrophosphate synthase